LKNFSSRKFEYNKHLNNKKGCKNTNNNVINDMNIHNDDLTISNIDPVNNIMITELMKKINIIIEQNEQLRKQNKELIEDINKSKNIQNYFNLNIQINNLNDIDYTKINFKSLIKEQ
jgi:hypothetical protein